MKRILLSLLLILLALFWLLASPAGFKLSMHLLAKYGPGQLSYESAQGQLFKKFTITKLRYRYHNSSISSDYLYFSWHPSSLLIGKYSLERLHLKNTAIVFDSSLWQSTGQSSKPQPLTLPKIAVDLINIQNLQLQLSGEDTHYQLKQLTASGVISKQFIQMNATGELTQPIPIKLKLASAGSLAHYQLKVNLKAPNLSSNFIGTGNDRNLELQLLPSKILKGTGKGSAAITWFPAINWQFKLNASKLNLKKLNNHLPSQVNFKINGKRTAQDSTWNLSKLSAVIKKQNLIATGFLHYRDNNHFILKAEANGPMLTANVNATHQGHLNGHWQIAIKQLDALWPGTQGILLSNGSYDGILANLKTTGKIQIQKIAVANYSLDAVSANWDIDLSEQLNSLVQLNINQLSSNNFTLNKINLAVNGKPSQHQIQLQLLQNKQQLSANLTGKAIRLLTNPRWDLLLTTLNLTSPLLGDWNLVNPVQISATPKFYSMTALQWRSAESLLNLSANWKKHKSWQLAINGNQLRLNSITSLFQPTLALTGTTDLFIHANGIDSTINNAEVNLSSSNAALKALAKPKISPLNFSTITFNSHLTQAGLATHFNLKLNDANYLNAMIALPGYQLNSETDPKQKISGDINLKFDQFQLLQLSLPVIDSCLATANGHIKLSGTIAEPAVDGKLIIADGSAKLSSLGLSLNKIRLSLIGSAQQLKFKLTASSNGAPFNLNGTAQWPHRNFSLTAELTGKQVPVINTNEYSVKLSPELKAKFSKALLSLSGKIIIPSANIVIANMVDTVTMPNDEVVYLDEPKAQQQAASQEFAPQFKTNIDLVLGDNIQLNALGIKGKLKGQIKIRNKPAQPLTGTGRVELVDGNYSAYGQKLKINKGQVNFTQSPLLNPNLDVQAVRYINTISANGAQGIGADGITVGVIVSGTINKPKTYLFSEPISLSQPDILSYLLFGTPSSSNSANSLGLLMQAFNSLNLHSDDDKGGLTQKFQHLQQGLGISELGVESTTTLDPLGNAVGQQNHFVVGKKLSDRFYMRYGIGIDNQISTLQLQYQLSKNWSLRADSSSIDTGGDIFYTIERGQ